MTTLQSVEPIPQQPLRLWPGIIAAVLLCVVRFVIPIIIPDTVIFGMLGGLVCTLAIVVWWVFFSRASWAERLGVLALMVIALIATRPLLHKSVATGAMGMLFFIYAIPVVCLTLVIGAVVSQRFSAGLRRALLVVAILLACGVFTLLRTGGITGDGVSDLHWRWTKTPEELLLAQASNEPTVPLPASVAAKAPDKPVEGQATNEPAASASTSADAKTSEKPAPALESNESTARAAEPASAKTNTDWLGFRGSRRDGVVRGVRIETDWAKKPPVAMWRKPVGPGWSSFAAHGDFFYTQEQRGDDEIVACYKVATGEPVWRHRDPVRFWESNGGAGPRATPTLSNGRVYTFGATGILNALDARNGAVVWSHNVATDTSTKVPMWGFSSSPLVVDDVVVVAASGTLVGYDIATGQRRWVSPAHGGSYSSPHRTTIDGVVQILLLSETGVTSVAPANGTVLWEHAWPGGTTIVQPALTADGDVLINSLSGGGGAGTRRLAVKHSSSGWNVEERWTSNGLKPYFNDFVVHKGHAIGFDGNILSCIDLTDGKRKWKGGRYGNGQLVLLPDQDLLLVLTEEGELALVGATTDQFKELGRFPAIEGKTWNHPALVGDVLLVRNGEQMAAFRLSLAGR